MDIATPERVMTDRMSGEKFSAFQQRRPDHERWELIAGIPMMMPPPTLIHNHIAENLSQLLNRVLLLHDPSGVAFQRMGI